MGCREGGEVRKSEEKGDVVKGGHDREGKGGGVS